MTISHDDLMPPVIAMDTMNAVSDTANRALQLTNMIESLEDALKEHKKELHELRTRTLPDLLAAVGSSEIRLSRDNTVISISTLVSGSLPKDDFRRKEALEWLRQNGAESLIKNTIQAEFARGQDNRAGAVEELLAKLEIPFARRDDVNANSLCAYVRERIRHGEEVPAETLGLFISPVAKIRKGVK